MDHHTVAAISITGTCLDVIGSLYLAYDLLGGQHGPLRLLTRREGSIDCEPAVSPEFLEVLLAECPACRHLSHLASSWAFSPEQAQVVLRQGVEPTEARHQLWMFDLPPSAFAPPPGPGR